MLSKLDLAFYNIFSVTLFAVLLALLVLYRPKITVKYSASDILFIALVLTIFLYIGSTITKLYTPDEYIYLKNALNFIKTGSMAPFTYVPSRSFSALITGRFLWQLLLAAFIAATSMQLPISLVNTPYLLMLLSAVTNLLCRIFENNGWKLYLKTVLVLVSPLCVTFYNYFLLDLAFASLSLVGIYYFTISFKQMPNVNIFSILKSLLVLLVSQLYKFFPIVIVPLWLIFSAIFIKEKCYRSSFTHKLLFLIIFIPVVAYELLLDVPALIAYYILSDRQLNAILAKFVFFSPIGLLINFLVKTPWTYRNMWEMPSYQKLFIFFNLIPIDFITPFVAASFLLSPLIIAKEKYEKRVFVLLSFLCFFTGLIGFWATIEYWDVQRYGLTLILLIQILGIETLFFIIENKKKYIYHMMFLVLLLIYFEYHVLQNYGYTSYLWGTQPRDRFAQILKTAILQSFLLSFTTIKQKYLELGKRKNIPIIIKKANILIIALSLIILLTNVRYISYEIEENHYFCDHNIGTFLKELEKLDVQGLVFSNIYFLPVNFAKDTVLIVSPPLSRDDFFILLNSNISFYLIFSNDSIITWPSHKLSINSYLKEGIISLVKAKKGTVLKEGKDYIVLEVHGKEPGFSSVRRFSYIANALIKDVNKTINISMEIISEKNYNATLIVDNYYFSLTQRVNINKGRNVFTVSITPLIKGKNIDTTLFGRETRIMLLDDESNLQDIILTSAMRLDSVSLKILSIIMVLIIVLHIRLGVSMTKYFPYSR
jgi:hypothetical protein